MSFLLGPISGALVAGGVYYGFSNMIQTRNAQLQSDLHTLSTRLLAADTYVPAPLPAAARIAHHPFRSQLKTQWNTQIESLFRGVQGIDVRVAEWGRKVFYGGDASREGSS